MSSSPTITNLFDDDHEPNEPFHEPNTPPDNVRVVSQSQTDHPFDHLVNAIAIRSEAAKSPTVYGTKATYEAYIDEGMPAQIPQVDPYLIKPGAAEVVTSPSRKSLLALFEAPNEEKKRAGDTLVNAVKKKNKKEKLRVYPFKGICGFLRKDAIGGKLKDLAQKKGTMSVSHDIKSALTSCLINVL